jgi:phage/plasmid-like protein (TIGR03299 family)
MAHNLDITNGVASFFSAREDAWHQLGQVLPDAVTAEQALRAGNLADWLLRKEALYAHVGDQQVLVPNKYAIVRNNPVVAGQVDVLGTVGEAYRIIQNEELTGLLDALVDESGAHYETAGAIDGGKKVFVTMKMPGNIKVGGVDPVDNYIAAMTSHDGSSATAFMVTPVRIVCQNTMNLAFKEASHMFKVRHTSGASKVLLQQAREALDFTFDYLDGFQQQAEQLINTTMTQSTFEQIIEAEFGAPEDAPAGTRTRVENKLDEMAQLFSDAHTQEGVRETAWAGLNSLTEWYDHFSPVRGVSADDEGAARSRKALLDTGFKNRALELMLAA